MLDDGARGRVGPDGKLVDQLPCGLGVVEVEVAQGQAAELLDGVPPTRGPDAPVTGAPLVRILSIAKLLLGAFEGEVDGGRQSVALGVGRCGLVEPRHDGGVVGGGVGERGPSEAAPSRLADRSLTAQLVEDGTVLAGVDDDCDMRVVLGRGPHHRRSADVDHLDAGLGPEGIEVADDEINALDLICFEVGEMLRIIGIGEDAAVDLGVERLDPPAEHLGRAGHRRHLDVGDVVFGQEARRAAARHQLDLVGHQTLGEGLEAGLVPHGEQGPHSISFKKRLTVSGNRRRSTALIRSCNVSSVSSARTSTASWARIGPASISSVTTCTVHPVTLTP